MNTARRYFSTIFDYFHAKTTLESFSLTTKQRREAYTLATLARVDETSDFYYPRHLLSLILLESTNFYFTTTNPSTWNP